MTNTEFILSGALFWLFWIGWIMAISIGADQQHKTGQTRMEIIAQGLLWWAIVPMGMLRKEKK